MPDAEVPVPSPSIPWWRRWRRGAPTSATTDAQPLRFGSYQVERLLGQGGSGPVYLAHDGPHAAALKVLTLNPAWSAQERTDQCQRFTRQADVLRQLAHPDIIAMLDSGVADGAPWLAMELAPGTDLTRYAQRQRLLPEPLVLRIGARVARALAHAHHQGIVHRDLKPANVRLDLGRDALKLVDFGVARWQDAQVTRTGVTLGTPAYMAPEQLSGEPADASTDTYALGVMLYELLSGRLPYPAANLGELLRAVAAGDAAPLRHWRPELPVALEALIAQLLQRHPSQRPQDLEALAAELERTATALQQTAGA